MSISLADLKSTTERRPPRVLIYGPEGLGKTTLGREFPEPVFLQVEDGAPAGMDMAYRTFGHLQSYENVMAAIMSLYTEDHNFQTVVADTIDAMEPLVWAATCEANEWESIEQPGYGKGYLAADVFWRDFLEGLNALRRDRDMAIVLLAHSEIERFDDPRTTSYSRFDYRLHKRAHAIVGDEMDAILFLNQDATIKEDDAGFSKKRARAQDTSQRWIYCERRPTMTAKNRYGMPDRVLFQKGKGYAALAPYLTGQPAPAAQAEPADAGEAEAGAPAKPKPGKAPAKKAA